MSEAKLNVGLRPMLPADVPLLAEIFRASVSELTGEDYSPAQQDVWIAAADDEAEFAKRLGGQLTLVATVDNAPVAFASLKLPDRIDMLYVHPALVGQGVGGKLADALERLAAARGSARLSVDASDSARDFFDRQGFVADRRNSVPLGGEWLATTSMVKPLVKKGGAP